MRDDDHGFQDTFTPAAGVSGQRQKSLRAGLIFSIDRWGSMRKFLWIKKLYQLAVGRDPGMWFAQATQRGAPWD